MANPYFRGHFIVKGAKGSVTMGAAGVMLDAASSGGWKDVSPIDEHRDAGGVIRTLTRDMIILECTYRLTPFVGDAIASAAAGAAALVLTEAVRKGDMFVATGFAMGTLNCAAGDYAMIWDIGGSQQSGGEGSYDVTVRKLRDSAGAAIDLTTVGWATL